MRSAGIAELHAAGARNSILPCELENRCLSFVWGKGATELGTSETCQLAAQDGLTSISVVARGPEVHSDVLSCSGKTRPAEDSDSIGRHAKASCARRVAAKVVTSALQEYQQRARASSHLLSSHFLHCHAKPQVVCFQVSECTR